MPSKVPPRESSRQAADRIVCANSTGPKPVSQHDRTPTPAGGMPSIPSSGERDPEPEIARGRSSPPPDRAGDLAVDVDEDPRGRFGAPDQRAGDAAARSMPVERDDDMTDERSREAPAEGTRDSAARRERPPISRTPDEVPERFVVEAGAAAAGLEHHLRAIEAAAPRRQRRIPRNEKGGPAPVGADPPVVSDRVRPRSRTAARRQRAT